MRSKIGEGVQAELVFNHAGHYQAMISEEGGAGGEPYMSKVPPHPPRRARPLPAFFTALAWAGLGTTDAFPCPPCAAPSTD